jgi:hypothetical protein
LAETAIPLTFGKGNRGLHVQVKHVERRFGSGQRFGGAAGDFDLGGEDVLFLQ